MKWTGKRYEVPGGGPGPLTRLYWALEDWWRFLDPVDKATIRFLVLGAILWILATRA